MVFKGIALQSPTVWSALSQVEYLACNGIERNRELLPLFDPFFERYMHLAVSQCCNAQKVRGYFKSASVDVSDEDYDVELI